MILKPFAIILQAKSHILCNTQASSIRSLAKVSHRNKGFLKGCFLEHFEPTFMFGHRWTQATSGWRRMFSSYHIHSRVRCRVCFLHCLCNLPLKFSAAPELLEHQYFLQFTLLKEAYFLNSYPFSSYHMPAIVRCCKSMMRDEGHARWGVLPSVQIMLSRSLQHFHVMLLQWLMRGESLWIQPATVFILVG